jgi:hypothetical protein
MDFDSFVRLCRDATHYARFCGLTGSHRLLCSQNRGSLRRKWAEEFAAWSQDYAGRGLVGLQAKGVLAPAGNKRAVLNPAIGEPTRAPRPPRREREPRHKRVEAGDRRLARGRREGSHGREMAGLFSLRRHKITKPRQNWRGFEPVAPIEHGGPGAVPLGHLGLVGLGVMAAFLAPDDEPQVGRCGAAERCGRAGV